MPEGSLANATSSASKKSITQVANSVNIKFSIFENQPSADSKFPLQRAKKGTNGKYQVGSGRIVTVTHDTPFVEDIVPQTDGKVNRKNSPSKKTSDTAYLSAVERGDMKTAQSDGYKKGATRAVQCSMIIYR